MNISSFNLPPNCSLRDADPDPRDESWEDGIEREQYESERAYIRELERQIYRSKQSWNQSLTPKK